MRKLQTALYDTEGNGLVSEMTKLHLICIEEFETGDKWTFRRNDKEDTIAKGIKMLKRAKTTVAHNAIAHDIPAIQIVKPNFMPEGRVYDSLVMMRLIFSHQKDLDFDLSRKGVIEKKDIGLHGLDAWGKRLGKHKGDYVAMMEAKGLDPWAEWNIDMEEYCENDVAILHVLWEKILESKYPKYPVILEHQTADLMYRQQLNGFAFDVPKAQEMALEVTEIVEDITKECRSAFPARYDPLKWDEEEEWGETTKSKRTMNFKDLMRSSKTEGAEFTAIKWVEFNPGSRDQVGERLMELGWEPNEFSEKTGKPSVKGEILERLQFELPIAKPISDYFLTKKILGAVETGDKAWLKYVDAKGFIHGYVNPCGAVTGRATHSKPNLGQVKRIIKTKEGVVLKGREGEWGWDCRNLFYAPEPFTLLGADLSGIELRCLAHYMYEYDGGSYAKSLLEGSVHALNQEILEVETEDIAKTFIYALLYGAGDEKLGFILAPTEPAHRHKVIGNRARTKFLNSFPALDELLRRLKREIKRNGYVTGIDGRRLHIRKAHAALNSLLQNAGAMIAKKWLVLFEEDMLDEGFEHSWDGDFAQMAWIHDETQTAILPEHTIISKRLVEQAALNAGTYFEFNIPTPAKSKVGRTWADTH